MSSEQKTVSRICSRLAFGSHRTKRNDFLIQSPWDETKVLKQIAIGQLKALYRPREPIFLVIDDSKKAKRGKRVEAVLKCFDPSPRQFIMGHQFVTAAIYYRGHTIPFAIRLYLNKASAKELKQTFKKLTALAAEIIDSFERPKEMKARVYVLVDSAYFNKPILKAAKDKRFFAIGALKKNRNLLIRGRKRKLNTYMHGQFQKGKKSKITIQTKRGKQTYRFLSGVFCVSRIPDALTLVFSRKGKHKKILAIGCTDPKLSASSIILYYSFRWSIEVWFKLGKQYLGLGALHRIRWEGVVKHLHLTACAFCLLTHLSLTDAKGKLKNIHAASSILPARDQLNDLFLEDAINYFVDKEQKNSKPSSEVIHLKRFLFDDGPLQMPA
jgi:hypothetical protein